MLTTPYSATFNVGDGETKQFPYLFDEVSENFISVMVYNTSTGITTTPTYIIDTDQKQIIFGDDTPAPTADEVVCIYRNTPEVQDVSFRTLQGYDAKSLENILSKIVAMIQELKSNYFSTQVLQGDPWQLDLLSSADDGATVNIDFTAKKLIKGLYFKITDGNLQVSADDSNYITMPKSSDIAEFRQISITLEDLSVIKNLQYRVGDTWFDAGSSTGGSNWGGIGGNITDQTDLMNKFTEYVRTDGSSIMTNPLMMRATEDFKCAIAPYWDGVGFFKLNDNNSVTLMASIEYNSGFEPATTNTYNIGASARKWKNLYLSGKAYMSVINNGYDIAVPVTNSADTFALKSQVDDAANSGEQLYTTGVWYAKMHSATVVPTGAEYDGRKYADFSQVDNDNNPIIVIYEGQSGSWVELTRITPPANHVGYITVTSKIWDIAEQTDQQGGDVLWSYNQKTFTPYPKIVSVAGCANTNLSNLTTTGKANVSAQGTYDSGETYTAGTVGAAIAGKVSKGHEVIAFQEPTAANNYTWYRLYADGWVEQGGTTSNFTNTAAYTSDNKVVSLPVAMANTKYDVQATLFSDISLGNGSISGYSHRVILPQIDSTTQFTIYQYTNSLGDGTSCCAKWYVCGMAA